MSPAADPSAARPLSSTDLPPESVPSGGPPRVAAVLVAHDGAAYLPRTLAALDRQVRLPDAFVAVDTGSRDDSVRLLTEALGPDSVIGADRSLGFGAAVVCGLAAVHTVGDPAGDDDWIWLLHDDAAPEPDTLRRLLDVAGRDPRIAVVGCRLRAWPRGRRLLEVGVTITGTGRRDTGLEPGEYDQGQHDEVRDVLAVSTAGMLIRRRVWDELGGFDARLPLFRDDVDLGWRVAAAGYRVVVAPRALVFHAEAAARGAREISCASRRPHRADRAAGLYTVLANCRTLAFPFLFFRLLVGSLLRALGYLVGKLPGAAWDEVLAAGAVFGRPWRLLAARHSRRRRVPARTIRPLLPAWWTPYAAGLDATLSRIADSMRSTAAGVTASSQRWRRRDPAQATLGAAVSGRGDGPLATTLRHPLLLVLLVLTVAAAIASRGLWGGGFLQGGGLPPAPDSAGAWWRLYAASWHPVGTGSTLDTAPYVALLAIPASVLLGHAWLVVDLLMLFAVPLTGLGAWMLAGRLVRGMPARIGIALAFGLVPVVSGAVGSGHVATVVATVALPWIGRGALGLLVGDQPRWRATFATGLALAVGCAFAPILWPVAALGATVAFLAALVTRRWLDAVSWVVVTGLPLVLLLPWSWRLVRDPGLLLTEAGRTVSPGSPVTGWQLLFGHVPAAGAGPWWLYAGLVGAAAVGLLRADTRARTVSTWVVAAAALVVAARASHHVVSLPLGRGTAYPWLGGLTVVVLGALVVAAGVAADGLADRVTAGSFGWRQPFAALALVAGLSAPLLGLGWWVGTAPHGDLHRGLAVPLPAYMLLAMSSDHARTLVLHDHGSAVRYQVWAGAGERLGDDSVLPAQQPAGLAALVADVLSRERPSDVAALGARGIRYIVLPGRGRPAAINHLDGLAGLSRTSTNESALTGWEVASWRPVTARSTDGVSRVLWLALQGLLWIVTCVLAAPGVRRRASSPELPDGGGAGRRVRAEVAS